MQNTTKSFTKKKTTKHNKFYYVVSNIFSWVCKKIGYIPALILSIAIPVILICLICFCIIDNHNKNLELQHQIEIEKMEQQQKEDEEKAAKAEQNKQLQLQKEIECVLNLKTLNLPNKKLNVDITYQYPELPSACECMALTNMLNYYGFNIDKFELVDKYLDFDNEDWVNYYVGSPYDKDYGGLMMCPAIKKVFNSFIKDHLSSFKGYDVTGKNFEDLFAYIERGNPVQIWSSLNMSDLGRFFSTIGSYKFYENSHSVLITGFDRDKSIVYIADSINGNVSYPISQAERIFKQQNSQAFIVVNQEELDKWTQGQDWSYDNTIPKIANSNSEENCDEDNDSKNECENEPN